jgi:hypothetical protein
VGSIPARRTKNMNILDLIFDAILFADYKSISKRKHSVGQKIFAAIAIIIILLGISLLLAIFGLA